MAKKTENNKEEIKNQEEELKLYKEQLELKLREELEAKIKAELEEETRLKSQEEAVEQDRLAKEKADAESEKYKEKDIRKLKKQDDTILNIYGFEIRANTIYEVQQKFDASAPEGLQEHSTSKFLNFDVEDIYPGAVWDKDRDNWDTGLYEGSKALRDAFPEVSDLTPLVSKLKEYIVAPLEAQIGGGKISHIPSDKSDEYWLKYRVRIKPGKIFNTENPEQLLELFLSVLHKRLTPKEEEKNPEFLKSQFVIVNKHNAISRKAEMEEAIMKATATFYMMLKSDRTNLLTILEFLGLPVGRQTEDATILAMFNNWLNNKKDKYQNYNLFNEEVEKFGTENGKEILYIYGKLKDFRVKGLVTEKRGEIYLDGVFVSVNGLKTAAEKIHNDKELYDLFVSFL